MAFSLAFSQAPPDHPFVGEYFPVQLTLIDADHEIHGGIELPLSLELYYEEKDKQVSKGVFEVEGSNSRILFPPSERGPSAPVPSNVYENWTGVDIMYYLDGRWRRQSLVYFGNP